MDIPNLTPDGQQSIPAWLQAQRDALIASLNSSGLQAQRSALAASLDSMELHPQAVVPDHRAQGGQARQALPVQGSEQSEASSPHTVGGVGPGSQPKSAERSGLQIAGTILVAEGSIGVAKGSNSEGYIAGSKGMSSPFATSASHRSTGPDVVSRAQMGASDEQEAAEHPQQAEAPPGAGKFARQRSGSFGGRGAALGYMLEAHQQWRQDSFSRAQVHFPSLPACGINNLGPKFYNEIASCCFTKRLLKSLNTWLKTKWQGFHVCLSQSSASSEPDQNELGQHTLFGIAINFMSPLLHYICAHACTAAMSLTAYQA